MKRPALVIFFLVLSLLLPLTALAEGLTLRTSAFSPGRTRRRTPTPTF